MAFLHLPKFIVPSNLSERIAQQQVRPLAICPKCGYVLCNCGNCHSEECLEECLHDAGGSASSSSTGNERVWCGACGGMYLPHEH